MSKPSVKSVMTRRVECVNADSNLHDALSCMASRNISCIVVVESDKLVGVLTERDIVKFFAQESIEKSNGAKVGDLMHSPVYTIAADLSLSEAANLMHINGFRRFPVVDKKGKLVGIVTQTDVLRGSVHSVEEYSRRLEKMVEVRTHALAEKNRELEVLSVTDSLTGLANRRYMYRRLEEELSRARRQGDSITCSMLDIDHFKLINDSQGHDFGDEILKIVSHAIRKSVRKEDLVARYGGEEFVIVTQCDQDGAKNLVERICEFVAGCRLPTKDGLVGITLSAGVAEYDPLRSSDSADELLRRADTALYAAKRAGRDCVVCYDCGMEMAKVG